MCQRMAQGGKERRMTREEARQGLQGYSLLIADGTDLKEALNMAIEALSADGDLISRADAIGSVYRLVDELPPKPILSKEPNKIYPSDVVKELSALPSAMSLRR